MALLQIKDLHAGYGRAEVLHGLNLQAEAGQVITVIGPNGAGKSTLLNALMGVIPSRGQIRALLLAWVCFSAAPAIHYLLIVYPLPHWSGPLDLIPLGITHLVGEAFFIGTLIVFGSVAVALRKARSSESALLAPAIAA